MKKQIFLAFLLGFCGLLFGMEAPEEEQALQNGQLAHIPAVEAAKASDIKSDIKEEYQWESAALRKTIQEMHADRQNYWSVLLRDLHPMVRNVVLFESEFQKYQNETGLFDAIEDQSPFIAQLLACGRHTGKHNARYPKTANGRKYEGVLAGYTPLCFAAMHTNFQAVQALLSYTDLKKEAVGCVSLKDKKDCFMQDNWARSALSRRGCFVSSWKRSTIGQNSYTALHAATDHPEQPKGHPDNVFYQEIYQEKCRHQTSKELIITALISAEASLEANDWYDRTPLDDAIAAQNTQTLRFLLKLGANPNATSANGITPLHVAARLGNVDLIELLHEYKAKIDVQDDCGRTPLYCAMQSEKGDAAKKLLALGATTDTPDTIDSLMALASKKGLAEVVELLHKSTDFSKHNNNKALWAAVYQGHVAIVSRLLAISSIDVNKKHSDGVVDYTNPETTPLIVGVLYRRYDIVSALLQNPNIDRSIRCDVMRYIKGFDGYFRPIFEKNVTAYEFAQKMGDERMVNVFEQHEKDAKKEEGCTIQ